MIRRRSLVTSMLAAPAVLGAASARAQGAWPNKPVKLIRQSNSKELRLN
jgi:hypothetical protein